MTSSVGSASVGEQLLQLAAHHRARVRVERRERLVEQQHARVARQRAGQRDALALAAGQLARARVGEVGDAEALQQLVDARRSPPKATFARTLRCGNSAYSWNTSPTERRLRRQVDARGARRTRSSPSSAMRPSSGATQAGDGAQRRSSCPRPTGRPAPASRARRSARAVEAKRAKLRRRCRDRGRHEDSILYESRIAALSTTSSTPDRERDVEVGLELLVDGRASASG